jgi:hypothetical protein
VITIWLDELDTELALPTAWAICDDCRGNGTRALHGIAITSDEWADWDDEDRHAYLSGHYDTICQACDGSGKVEIVDEERCPPEVLAQYHRDQTELASLNQMEAMERAMGA